MAGLTAEQFRKLLPNANNEPITKALATGLNAIRGVLDPYKIPESVPLLGGQSAADLTGLTGAQGVVQDFSRGNLQYGDMRMFDLLGLGAGVAPAARTAVKGGGLLGKEALRQMNEGTGLLSKLVPDPRQYIDVYHGSPYIFDKFNMNKIGTGEGAQAYGHGLYFAENPAIAKSYQDTLGVQKTSMSQMASDNLQGVDITPSNIKHLHSVATDSSIPLEKSARIIQNANASLRKVPDDVLTKLISDFREQSKGYFYKVNIPDEAIPKMLDYDAPVKDQPHVLSAIRNRLPEDMIKSFDANVNNGITGANAYKNWLWDAGKTEASKAETLRQLGITGIRYLDGSSRGLGTGSSNFVVFDDKLPTILERNGKSAGLLGTKKN